MAKKKVVKRKPRVWDGRVWVTLGATTNFLCSPDAEPFPDWIKTALSNGYTKIRITEILPKPKKGVHHSKEAK